QSIPLQDNAISPTDSNNGNDFTKNSNTPTKKYTRKVNSDSNNKPVPEEKVSNQKKISTTGRKETLVISKKTLRNDSHNEIAPEKKTTIPTDSNNEVTSGRKRKRTATPTASTSTTILEEKCNSYTNSNDEITPGDSNDEPYTRRKER
ncbi:5587_t:CDS:2, partial [Gigaspora rosea]